MKKYKDIFKSGFFWCGVIFLTLLEKVLIMAEYGNKYPSMWIGLFIGSFLMITIFFSIIHFLRKIIDIVSKK